MEADMRMLGVVFVLLMAAIPTADAEPKMVGPVVFHWFRGDRTLADPGQYQTVWLPVEGRSAWDGSVAFWKGQDALIAGAGFTFEFFDVAHSAASEERNHLIALRDSHLMVAPYFAPESGTCYACPRDLETSRGRDAFYEPIHAWFVEYLSLMPSGRLAMVQGRVLVGLWWFPISGTVPRDLFSDLNDRLWRDFGMEAFWSTHEQWVPAGPDEVNRLFWDGIAFQPGTNHNVTLQAGAWEPNSSYPTNAFLARNGGETYRGAWQRVIAERTSFDRVYTVWNEYTEGSGIYPAVPMRYRASDAPTETVTVQQCWDAPCHPVSHDDWWGSAPDLYLTITREYAAELLTVK